mmetsp:Transcript_30806/g.98552  ORF Transcript_30806/g.98552 Transcript_30806/m.98552 type:complete len:245 (-) Transcript_30806:1139-1873(-)
MNMLERRTPEARSASPTSLSFRYAAAQSMCRQPALMAACTAAPTSPGAASHVPRPMRGIALPEFKVSSFDGRFAGGATDGAGGRSADVKRPLTNTRRVTHVKIIWEGRRSGPTPALHGRSLPRWQPPLRAPYHPPWLLIRQTPGTPISMTPLRPPAPICPPPPTLLAKSPPPPRLSRRPPHRRLPVQAHCHSPRLMVCLAPGAPTFTALQRPSTPRPPSPPMPLANSLLPPPNLHHPRGPPAAR